MTPNIEDQFTFVAVNTKTNLESPGYTMGATDITCTDLSEWVVASDNTAVYFAIDVVDDDGDRIPGTYTEWKGIVSGNTIGSLQLQDGFVDQDYASGTNTRVYMVITQSWANAFMAGILALVNQDSTLKDETVGATQLKPGAVTTVKIAPAAVTDDKWRNNVAFYAYKNANQTGVAANTFTAMSLQEEIYDFGNNFDTTTGIFTAPFDGVYSFSGSAGVANDTLRVIASIYKNGIEAIRGSNGTYSSQANRGQVSGDLFLETGDEVQLYAYRATAGTISAESTHGTFLSGHLVTRGTV